MVNSRERIRVDRAFGTFMRTTAAPAQRCLTSSLLLFSCQMADDFLGTSFLRVFNCGIDRTLILDGPSERHDSIPNCDVNEIAVDVRT